MDTDKIILGVTGALFGWLLKQATEYFTGLSASEQALYRFEGELKAILSQAAIAENSVEIANQLFDTDKEAAERKARTSVRLIEKLPSVKIFGDRYESISRSLSPASREIAMNVVTYYNAMRAAFEEQKPDLNGIRLLLSIVRRQRELCSPVTRYFRLFHAFKLRNEIRKHISEWEQAVASSGS